MPNTDLWLYVMTKIVITTEEILSFDGNNTIPSIEALVDEAFIAEDTISIENQEKKYSRAERAKLITEIYRIYNENI